MSVYEVLSTARRGKKMASVSPRAAHAEAHDRQITPDSTVLCTGRREDTNIDIPDKHGRNDTHAAKERSLGVLDTTSDAALSAERVAAATLH